MILAKQKPLVVAILSATVLGTSGCATIKKNLKTVYGCTTGAVIGALGGALAGNGNPKYIAGGAVAGLVVGCGVGYYLQNREEKLAENAAKHGYNAEFVRISDQDGDATAFSKDSESDVFASQMTISSNRPFFKSGKSQITDRRELANLDSFIKDYIKGMNASSKIYIVGHTDSSGSAYYNQKLSEKRAEFIARRFARNGAPEAQIFFEGVGENQPIASNQTTEGKAKNRRFEIIDIFNDSTLSSAVPLEKVAQVSRAKKQRISNVMNEKGLTLVNEQMNARKSAEKAETNSPRNVATSDEPIKTAENTTPVHVKDSNPLNLEGVKFDTQRSARELTQTLGVYHDDSWSLISKAYADPGIIDSCAVSEPRVSSSIKTLGDGGSYSSTSDHLPGMIGNMWYNKIDPDKPSTMVILGPVTVNKDSFESEGRSDLAFIKNYHNANQSIDYRVNLNVETYRGDDAVLYRVYPKGKSSIKCADFVFSTKGELVTKHAEIIYASNGNMLTKTMNLKTKL